MAKTGKLEHAYFTLTEPSSSGGKKGVGGKTIKFSFNPKEFTLARTAEWKAKPSKKPTMPEFVGSKPSAVTVEMFLDASEGGDVTERVEQLFACVDPHPKTKKDKPSPPFVSFGWGEIIYFERAVMKSVSVKFTRFRLDGSPIRATATVVLEQLQPTTGKQNPTSGTLEAQTERVVTAGDSLASLAYRELGSASLWRAIAEANNIDDPSRIRSGTRVLIPSIDSTSAN